MAGWDIEMEREVHGWLDSLDMARRAWRITYWFAPARLIVALTVFAKQRNNEHTEVRRARAAMVRCQEEHQR